MKALLLFLLALSVYSADFQIVIPATPYPVEKLAAEELRHYISLATGKSGEIVDAPSGNQLRFLLGRAAGINGEKKPDNSFSIKTTGNQVSITGFDGPEKTNLRKLAHFGTLYGVYDYLETQYGIRFLWPGKTGTFVPKNQPLQAGSINKDRTPPFAISQFRKYSLDWNRKTMRHRGPAPRLAGKESGHAFGWWRQEFFATNPDFFAARDAEGKQRYTTYSTMCVSNPKLHDKIVELWSRTPELGINCRENDGHGNCACRNCRAWDGKDERWPSAYYQSAFNAGERYGRFYRTVFDKARAINPAVKLYAYAYMNYVYAPRNTKLHRDVIISFVDDLPFPRSERNRLLVDREVDAWIATGASLIWRPNFTLAGYAMPLNYARQYAALFKKLYGSGQLIGMDFDGPNLSWATLGFNWYVMSRLASNPERSFEELESEYCAAFGPAAETMREYLRYWENYTMKNADEINRIYEQESARRGFQYGFFDAALAHRFFPPRVYDEAEKILARAADQTKPDEAASEKIDFIRRGLTHSRLCIESCAIFANPQTDNPERLKNLERVKTLRKTLPPEAADVKYFEHRRFLEGHAWKLRDVDPADAVVLPEIWDAVLSHNRVEPSDSDAGTQQLSTWTFVDDQIFGGSWEYCRYQTKVALPPERRKERVYLHLGAVDESCEVWVNGKAAGRFDFNADLDKNSWNKPQEFDITHFVRFDAPNDICVLVHNQIGKGGLWRPSHILFRPELQGETRLWNFAKGPQGWSLGSLNLKDGAIHIPARPGLQPAKITSLKIASPGEKFFEIGADVKTVNFPSHLLLAIRETDAANKTIGYRPLNLNPAQSDAAWRKMRTVIKVRKHVAGLQLYLIPDSSMPEKPDAYAQVSEIYLVPVRGER